MGVEQREPGRWRRGDQTTGGCNRGGERHRAVAVDSARRGYARRKDARTIRLGRAHHLDTTEGAGPGRRVSVVSITKGHFFKLSDGLAMNQRLLTEPGASRAGTLPGSSRRIVGHAYGAGDLPGGWIVAVAGPPRRLRPPVASRRLTKPDRLNDSAMVRVRPSQTVIRIEFRAIKYLGHSHPASRWCCTP